MNPSTMVSVVLRGFRVLRVYGNDPRLSHVGFLNRCKALGLKVVVAAWLQIYPLVI